MPLPLIPVLIGLVVVALGAGGVKLYLSAQGKRLAVLGTRMSGKTTLIQFLREGTIEQGYRPTKENEPFSETLQLRDLQLKISGEDLSGDKSRWPEWRKQAEESDGVCFLAAWHHLDDEELWPIVERAADQVGSWNLEKPVILIVTHLDKAVGHNDDSACAEAPVKRLKRLLQASEVHAVNLTDSTDRARVGYQVLEMLK